MARISKAAVVISVLGALALNSWHSQFYAHLPVLTAAAFLAGVVGARFAPRPAVAVILLLTYWIPALFLAVVGDFYTRSVDVWIGALLGVLIAERGGLTWSYPRQWRFALVLWALIVALGWPVVVLREMDFASLSLLERYRIPNTGLGGSPVEMLSWVTDFAIAHLVGLLWFDWLFRRAGDVADVRRWIVLPLAISAIGATGMAIYQGVFNIGFLSDSPWPGLGRATGSLMDANAFGMIAALWSAGFLALSGGPRVRALRVVGSIFCWVSLWMSGSRTALLCAVIGLALIGLAALRRAWKHGVGLRGLAAGAIAVGLVVITVWSLPARIQNPLHRLRPGLPKSASQAAVTAYVWSLWDRDTYGTASTALIASQPVVGVGIGMFHMLGAEYLRAHERYVPTDNAQNWWRHQVAEMGVIGALGLLLWTALFGKLLLTTRGEGDQYLASAALKGALLGFGCASLFGMPAQHLPVVLTFWTFAFWYTTLVLRADAPSSRGLGRLAWTAMGILIAGYLTDTVIQGRGVLRPAKRAAEGGWRYTYGMGPAPPPPTGDGLSIWTEQHGVTVVPASKRVMVLSVRAQHPDLNEHPVHALVIVNGQTVVQTKLYTDAPLVRQIEIDPGPRAIIETRVDRTWHAAPVSGPERDVGLALSWKFADSRIPQ